MKKSETISQLAVALCKFSAEVGKIAKDRANPHFKSTYATLDALIEATRPLLSQNGLTIMQFPAGDENGNVVMSTMLMHESGEWIESDTLCIRPVLDKNGQITPHAVGSAITYTKRFQYGAILSLSTGEDDDSNLASGVGNQQRANQSPPANQRQTNNLAGKVADAAAQTVPESIRDQWTALAGDNEKQLAALPKWYAQERAAGKTDQQLEEFLAQQMEAKIEAANA